MRLCAPRFGNTATLTAAIPCRAFSTKVSVLKDYAAYLLDVPAIVALDDDGEARYDTRTFGEIFARRAMTDDEVFHAMSMVFPMCA